MYYIKKCAMYLVILLFTIMTGYTLMDMEESSKTFPLIMSFLNFFVYMVMLLSISYKEGQDAYKVLIANDAERRQIAITGEDKPLRLKEEFAVWKGFFIPALSCLIQIVLILLHVIVYEISGGTAVFGELFFYTVLSIYPIFHYTIGKVSLYLCLILPLVTILGAGFGYYLGGKKIKLQQDHIKEIHDQIYHK